MEREDLLYKSIKSLKEDVADFRQETNHRFDRIDGRFDGMEKRLDNHANRLSSLETVVAHGKWVIGIFIALFGALTAWLKR